MGFTEELFRHNSWANLKLLEVCAGLPPETLEKSMPGTYGTIIATLRHISGADERYLTFLTGEERRQEVMEPANLGLDELRKETEERAQRWERVLAGPLEPEQRLTRTRPDGSEVTLPARTLLVQAIHHGNDHRTHICSILGSLELEVPGLDAWTYYGH